MIRKNIISLFAVLSLSLGATVLLTACGRNEAIPVCPPFMTAQTETPTVAAWDYLPQMAVHYEDEDFESSAQLTLSPSYTWGATLADGSHALVTSDSGARPYQMEGLCTVMLADTVGEVRLAVFEEVMNAVEGAEFYAAEALTGLTLTAYPVAEDGAVSVLPETSQSIPVANGRFTIPVGKYYYELALPRDGGMLTYGFIAHRIDAEEYQIINHWDGGCCVEVEYEDPDHMIKYLFYDDISLYRPYGREGNGKHGKTLFPTGKVTHTYTNYAGTVIYRHADLGDPMAEEDMHFVTTSELNIDYEIEWPWNHKVTAAQYERYTHDGTLVDGKTLIADGNGTHTVRLEPNFYYVFTVYYEDLSSQYVLKTGKGVDEITAHPMDDPSIDPDLAKYLRAEHMHCMHTALDSLDTVDVYIYRYLGQYGGMEAVIFEEPDHVCRYLHSDETVILGDQRLVLPDGRQLFFYHTHRFYRPEEAYKNGWITDADVSAMIELFPEIVPTHQLVSEGDPLLLLTRSLPGTGTAREIRLTPLGADGVDPSLGKQLYRAEGIYTMKYAEAPAQFEVQCDPTLAAKYVAITRYALIDPTHGKNILLHNGSLTLEAGYYYEFEVVCESKNIRYGLVTASERTVPTSPTDPHEVALHYTENGVKKQTTITKSLSSTRWTEWGEVSETAVATPYQMPDLCRINATQASASLQEGMEIAAFVITATPVDENGKYLPNAEKTSFTVDDNTFTLLEGSYYYAVYVCYDGSSFTRYGFIAHYDPQ